MTAKAWCAISKAVKLVAAAQNTSVGRAQAWLIEACVAGNVRAREPWRDDPILLLPDDGILGMEFEPSQFGITAASVTISRKRTPRPVTPATWKGAVIDKDVLVDVDHVRCPNVEISLADLDFELRPLARFDGASPASPPIPKKGGRPSDKDAVAAEAEKRLAAGENLPSSLAAFSRDLNHWLDKQPWAKRSIREAKVLSAPSIEEHIRPLWRKYRGE
jgi:hypothetical protein